jgi:YD repeat-containing protein
VVETNFPSSYSDTYEYDANNNLTSKTDRNSHTIDYEYDEVNRLVEKTYPDSSTVAYTYDLAGKLTQVVDPTGTYSFSYDNMGRLTGTTTAYSFLTGRNFTTAYAYDAASNRTGFTDPESGSTTYSYDTLNRLTTISPPSAITTGSFGFMNAKSYSALGGFRGAGQTISSNQPRLPNWPPQRVPTSQREHCSLKQAVVLANSYSPLKRRVSPTLYQSLRRGLSTAAD